MRVKVEKTTVYKFEELSEKGKQNAIEGLYDICIHDEWWECIYEDANTIGLKITGFDTDRGNHCDMEYVDDPETVVKKILENHGKDCDTYKTAVEFKKLFDVLRKEADAKDESITEQEDMEETSAEFLKALSEDYLSILRKEYEYLGSTENIIETIKINGYEFTEDGKLA